MAESSDEKYPNQHDNDNDTRVQHVLGRGCDDRPHQHYHHDEAVEDAEDGCQNELHLGAEPEAAYGEDNSGDGGEDVGLN